MSNRIASSSYRAREGSNVPQASRFAESIDVTVVLRHQTRGEEDALPLKASTEGRVGFWGIEVDPVSLLGFRSEEQIGPVIVVMVAVADDVHKGRLISAKGLDDLVEVLAIRCTVLKARAMSAASHQFLRASLSDLGE